MHFATPLAIWLIIGLTPALALFFWWTWCRRQAAIRLVVRERLVADLTVGVSKPIQIAQRFLLWLGVAALLLALARPRWGFIEQEAQSSGLDIVVCFDVSRSMLAADLKPNRMTRAKMAAYDLISLGRSDRLGLVAFAGTAFLQCPLALDPEAFRQSIAALDTEVIPESGTFMAGAIQEARDAFSTDSQAARVIVILTDGEDHEPGAIEAARRAYRDGFRIFTLGVGTEEGDLLRTSDPYGNTVFVRDDTGNVVRSKMDPQLLKELAEAGGGFFLPLQTPGTMEALYDRGLTVLPKGSFSGGRLRQWQERYQWPLALGVLFLVCEVLLLEHRRSRRRANPEDTGLGSGTVSAQ